MKRAATLAVAAAALCAAAATAATLEERAAICASCHGERGSSMIEGIPSLSGQPEFFLMNQLILMREGVRPVPQMEPFVKDLRDEEILALARRYAAEPPQRTPEKVDPALAARGEEIARRLRCASCHLPSLEGQEQMPRLAGQRIDYMIAALKAYRDNTRAGADTQMSAVVFGASDADIDAMAHYAAAK
ncbi:MAG TPA: c-type cytochrome [Beijerinckiaceae bacterium]|jgi:cytochrome c553